MMPLILATGGSAQASMAPHARPRQTACGFTIQYLLSWLRRGVDIYSSNGCFLGDVCYNNIEDKDEKNPRARQWFPVQR
jgi:hypothetical protein